jgi:hypothetical protein
MGTALPIAMFVDEQSVDRLHSGDLSHRFVDDPDIIRAVEAQSAG